MTRSQGVLAILGTTAALVLAGCSTTGGPGGEAKPAPEIELSASPVPSDASNAAPAVVQVADRRVPNGIYRMTTRGGTVLNIPELQTYVESVLRRVMRPVESAPYDGDVGVFVTSRASFNATATPGGDILVPIGVLRQVDNEEELAFILAHELTHVLREDLQRSEALAAQDRLAVISRRLADVALDLGTKIAVERIGDPEKARELQRLKRQIKASVRSLQLLVEGGLAPKWTLAQERTADRTAIELLHKAGYDPLPAQSAFDHIGGARQERRKQVERHIERVERLLKELTALSSDTRLEQTLKAAGIEVGGELVGKVADLFAGRHDEPAERAKAFSEYIADTYPKEMNVIGGQTKRLEATLSEPNLRQVMEKLQLAREAAGKLQEAQTQAAGSDRRQQLEASAVRLARQSISGRGGTLGYTRMVFHEIRQQTGHTRYAELNLTKIADRDAIGPAPWIELARFHADQGEASRAQSVVDRIAETYGEDATYPVRYAINRKLKRKEKAQAALDACLVKADSRFVRERCKLQRSDYAQGDTESAESEPGKSNEGDPAILEDAGDAIENAFQ